MSFAQLVIDAVELVIFNQAFSPHFFLFSFSRTAAPRIRLCEEGCTNSYLHTYGVYATISVKIFTYVSMGGLTEQPPPLTAV